MNRIVNIDHGLVMVVTDLHGDWPLYQRYRDVFLRMHARGVLDTLVFTGDLIHSEGPSDMDQSLEIVLDLIKLRDELGPDLVVLLGNHELPHLYAVVLSKGDHTYTPRFEAAMRAHRHASHREAVLAFFDTLPFYGRTRAGVALCHAGAFPETRDVQAMAHLFAFSHRNLWQKGAAKAPPEQRPRMRARLGELSDAPYDTLVREFFAITGPDDPHYDDHLIYQFVGADPAFELLWSALFVQNESDYGRAAYANYVVALLHALSEGYTEQSVLVAGHIGCRGGYRILAKGRQLRLASGIHAHPYASARYLIFDAAKPVVDAEGLLPGIGSVFGV